jgi:hypothetical protein
MTAEETQGDLMGTISFKRRLTAPKPGTRR